MGFLEERPTISSEVFSYLPSENHFRITIPGKEHPDEVHSSEVYGDQVLN